MNRPQQNLPARTVQTIAKSFFKETTAYGFSKLDYVRFVNLLLEMSFSRDSMAVQSGRSNQGGKS